ncbi:MAG: CoA pyrophosphatase [Acidobacteria bacterium CG_4_9_14_3_um_filter_49_7]|nr:MAG: CoA pyrophosphatase [Acidobacteria bacterium CG_4_9_14_3_um_filter_49_7]
MDRDTIFLENLKEKLRRCPVLNGRDAFIRSAVLALLVKLDGEYHLVFQKRNPNIRQGDEISFPGGRISKKRDNDVLGTALRETEEEMGISRGKISILGNLDFVIAPTGNLVDVVVGVADVRSLAEFEPNSDEVSRIFSVPLSWFRDNPPEVFSLQLQAVPELIHRNGEKEVLFPAKELGLPPRYHGTWKGGRLPVFVYRWDGEVIWGITARIINDLITRLFSVN